MESVLGNLDFRSNEKLDEALVKASGLFPHYDIYNGNDYLEADYHDSHFIRSDIHLQAAGLNVSSFNQAISVFPSSIIANGAKYTAKEFFEAEEIFLILSMKLCP